MKYPSELYYCAVCTAISLLICIGFMTVGAEHDTSGFLWVGFISGMFLMFAVRGAGVTWAIRQQALQE